ncbi:LysR family transcriptional regulator [Veronia pacifica]|uniref:LysR family transcriptional regulator n=1 Tax=Veronia pacifica TaxID=1080227 RepID=A0A1C3EST1_9GAMM|nr:LysR family transcriptional regulator [Veronia pacifica]ODA36296.1 LysR family transcriptional regulator [Veronia pacifica]
MRLEIRHWQLLDAIGKYGSLGAAANVLGVTQPAMSHRLAEAERRLGGAIFERDGRKLKPTPAGQALIQTASSVLPELSRAEDEFERTAANASHLVRVGMAQYSAYHWVPGFLKSLAFCREKVQIDFVAAATREAEVTLITGKTDIIISPARSENPLLDCKPLIRDELVLITHPEHALASKPWIEAQDLVDEDYLTYSLDALPGFEYERFIRPSGIRIPHIQMVEMTDAIVEMIAVDLGVSILSRWALKRSIKQALVAAVSVTKHGLPLTWYIISRKQDGKNEAIKTTAESLQQWFLVNESS